jgi:tetratricopeptide (TPR) repeat protein
VIRGTIHNCFGLALRHSGKIDEAEKQYKLALAAFEGAGWEAGQADVLGNLGNITMDRIQLDGCNKPAVARALVKKAESFHLRAIELSRRLAETDGARHFRGLGQDYGNLGVVLTSLGEFRKASEHFENRIMVATKPELADVRGAANGHGNQGMAFVLASDKSGNGRLGLKKAASAYQRALELHRQIKNRRGIAAVTGNRGLVTIRLGGAAYLESAARDFEESRQLFLKLGDVHSANLAEQHRKAAERMRAKPKSTVKEFEVLSRFHWADKYGKITDLDISRFSDEVGAEVSRRCQKVLCYFASASTGQA